jgi:hypothetical protein
MSTRCCCVLTGSLLLLAAPPALAQTALPPITVGAGLQTSAVYDSPDEGDSTTRFLIPSARLYFSGPVTDEIKFMFNTEYRPLSSEIGVLDAVAQIAFSPQFNVWAGRFLPPSDRANLYGNYYSHHWSVYSDGLQDGYPFAFVGRDNGVMYWGQFSKVKVAAGAFDGPTTTGDNDVLGAFRGQIDFWDPEDGYYLNGTYYGAKDLLAVGLAAQVQSGNSAWNADFLLEKKLGNEGVISIESQYHQYNELGGYDPQYRESDGAYILAAYLFPQVVGKGKFEVLGKYAHANFHEGLTELDADYDQKTTEIDLNYLIKEFNARVMIFFKNTNFSAVKQDFNQFGVGLQIQM